MIFGLLNIIILVAVIFTMTYGLFNVIIVVIIDMTAQARDVDITS